MKGAAVPATKTTPSAPTRATGSAKAKTENDARVLERVAHALEAAQDDLASIGGSLGAGARDLRKDVERMLRDVKKMSKAVQRDLERLQKDLTKTPAKDGRARAAGPTAGKTPTKAPGASR
jgi:hypothetical protein